VGLLLLVALACPFAEEQGERVWSAEDSYAEFAVSTLGFFSAGGVFRGLSGRLLLDRGQVIIEAEIAVESLEGLRESERRWALGPAFFDAAHHPRIFFQSEPIPCAALQGAGSIPGQLSIKGVRRPVRFELSAPSCARAGLDCPLEAKGVIRRTSFSLGRGALALGDRILLRLSIRLARETARE
jgi:polyisoprenoid-binding protein YceI